MPQKWQKMGYLDDQIQKMDQSQLEQFIRQRSMGLVSAGPQEDNSEEGQDSGQEVSSDAVQD
jgi:hypothetical protein